MMCFQLSFLLHACFVSVFVDDNNSLSDQMLHVYVSSLFRLFLCILIPVVVVLYTLWAIKMVPLCFQL